MPAKRPPRKRGKKLSDEELAKRILKSSFKGIGKAMNGIATWRDWLGTARLVRRLTRSGRI